MRTFPEHNDLIPLLRAIAMTGGRKRGGAKYGPPPKKPTHERMQSPAPMGAVVRTLAYTGDGRALLTARQERQLNRMVVRNADRHAATDLVRDLLSRKGRPTPKRKASR